MLKNCLFRIVHGKLFSLAYPFLPLHFRHFLSLYSSESSFSRALHVNFWIRRFTLEQKLSDDVFAQEEETSFEEQTALCVKLQFCSPREWQESAEWNQNNGYGLKLGRTQPDSFRACESFAWIWGPIRNSAPFRFRGSEDVKPKTKSIYGDLNAGKMWSAGTSNNRPPSFDHPGISVHSVFKSSSGIGNVL